MLRLFLMTYIEIVSHDNAKESEQSWEILVEYYDV